MMTAPATSQAPSAPYPTALIAALALLAMLVLVAAAAALAGGLPRRPASLSLPLLLHIGSVIPALALGLAVLMLRKGTALHRRLGRIWGALMMVAALSSFWLRGAGGALGPIHILSVVTLVAIPLAIWRARRGDIVGHRRAMLGPYIGLVLAGVFAFLPGRLLGDLVATLF